MTKINLNHLQYSFRHFKWYLSGYRSLSSSTTSSTLSKNSHTKFDFERVSVWLREVMSNEETTIIAWHCFGWRLNQPLSCRRLDSLQKDRLETVVDLSAILGRESLVHDYYYPSGWSITIWNIGHHPVMSVNIMVDLWRAPVYPLLQTFHRGFEPKF